MLVLFLELKMKKIKLLRTIVAPIYWFVLCWYRSIFGYSQQEKWVYQNENNKLSNNSFPKIIWIYWDSAERNFLVERCISQVRKLCPDYDITILNRKNVIEYVDLSKINYELTQATLSDYIRLALLRKYGGVWMDASVFLLQDLFWVEKNIKNFSTLLFYTDLCTLDQNNPVCESWFIAAKKNNDFINDWFLEFELCVTSSNPYLYYKDYFNKKDIIQKIPNTDYLMIYVAAEIVKSKKKYDIVYLNSKSTGHYYNYKFCANGWFIARNLLFKDKRKVYNPKLIKFTSDIRDYINKYLEKGNYDVNSVVGSSGFNKGSSVDEK